MLNVSPASFWMPDYLAPSAWHEHGPFAFWLVDALRPKRIVELGTHFGYSYFTFCQAIKRSKIDTATFAVDTWRGDEHAGFYSDEVHASVCAQNGGYASFSNLLRCTFENALPHFDDGTVDLLHIDGRHQYDDVKSDYESWLRKLTGDAVVLFHDTNVRERDFGVWKFFRELSEAHPSFEFLHGHGLGVICPGGEIPPVLRGLMNADADVARATRLAYAALGDRIAESDRAAKLREGVDALHSAGERQPDAIIALASSFGADPTLRHVGNIRAAERAAADEAKRRADQSLVDVRRQAQRAAVGARQQAEREVAEARRQAESHNADVRLQAEREVAEARRQAESNDADVRQRAEREVVAVRRQAEREVVEARQQAERELAAARQQAERETGAARAALTGERTQRLAMERQHSEARVAAASTEAEVERLSQDVRLLRHTVRGRDAKIGRLWRGEGRSEALARATTDLRTLLRNGLGRALDVEARAAARDVRLRELFQTGRSQVHALRRALDDERRHRGDAEKLLATIGRSRLWRALAKVRPLLGRARLPVHTPALGTMTDEDLRLVSLVERTGFFDRSYYVDHNPDVARGQVHPALHFGRSGWKEGRRPNADFDPAAYLARNPSVAIERLNPLVHFADYGLDERIAAALDGHDTTEADHLADEHLPVDITSEQRAEIEAMRASGLFDPAFYAHENPDVLADGGSPLAHFASLGWKELRDPGPGFDTGFYLSENPDVAAMGINPLVHYIEDGRAEGRAPRSGPAVPSPTAPSFDRSGLSPDEAAAVDAVLATGLFDDDYYLSTNPDVAAQGSHPAVHFAVEGWREGRNPSASFDTDYYLACHGDVAAEGENPLVHYAEAGAAEGRLPSPLLEPQAESLEGRLARDVRETGLFEDAFYTAHNPDIVADGVDPALHFERDGWREGRRPNRDFDPRYYRDANPDVAKLDVNPLLHFAQDGIVEGRRPGPPASSGGDLDADYARWVAAYDTLTDGDRRAIRARLVRLKYRPLISIVMPVYNTDLRLLREAIGSVQAQLYPDWELCIADDASTAPGVRPLLEELAEAEPRIKLVMREENGHISASSNSALAVAAGEFVALMDHDDIIPEHALFVVAASLEKNPNYDLIYSDEDHIDGYGKRHMPYFKSDFNPDLLLGHNFVSHLGIFRREIVEEVGGFRIGYEGSQDYDLALRVIDATTPCRILHIPEILYHWRSSSGEATFSRDFLDRCIASARRAIKDHLLRTGQVGDVVDHPIVPSWHRVRRARPIPAPLVSIIVPTKDKIEILKPCCDGILQRTDYPNIELIIVDHDSTDVPTMEYIDSISCDKRVRVISYRGIFNYSSINNQAVIQARGSVIAFLNNDVEIIDGDWLDEMVALAVQPRVGAVGAKLLYADGRVQHGGVVLGAGGVAGHSFHLLGGNDPGIMGRAVLTTTVSAVTGACLVLRKELFEDIGGFDERNLAVAFNDIDLCLKIRKAGFDNVLAAQAVLYHHESLSRGTDSTPEKMIRFQREAIFMMEKWGDELKRDPFYNPNFNLAKADFMLSHPPMQSRPWSKFD